MQLYFIRHAQSENNAAWYRLGTSQERNEDPELTETGWRQAALLAQHLATAAPDPGTAAGQDSQNRRGYGITHLYASLMVRAVSTGALVGQALGLRPVAWEDIHEGGGIYLDDPDSGARVGRPGKSRSYFEARFPALVPPAGLGEEGWWNRPFEEREQRLERARRFLGDLRARHGGTDDRVAIISHGGFFNYVMCALLNLPAREGFWFLMNNAAISRFDFGASTEEDRSADEVGITYVNRVDFLPAELVT
jgi:2,3-bisphosphoglycerate-dependent phosphoglycerate mutase